MSATTGSATITAGGREIHVLYNNRALAEAEKMLGKGILGVLKGFGEGNSGIGDLAILLQVGMEHARRAEGTGGKRVILDDAYRLLDECGFVTLASPVFEAIAAVLSYTGEADTVADPN